MDKGDRHDRLMVDVETSRRPFYTNDAIDFAEALARLCKHYGVTYEIKIIAGSGPDIKILKRLQGKQYEVRIKKDKVFVSKENGKKTSPREPAEYTGRKQANNHAQSRADRGGRR